MAGDGERSERGAWGVRCYRSNGFLPAAEAWLKNDGRILRFDSREEAQEEANRLNERTMSPAVRYRARRFGSRALR